MCRHRSKALFAFILFLGNQALADKLTNFASQMAQTACARQVRQKIPPALHKQIWVPKPAANPGQHLMDGVMFRDTVQFKSYQVYSDKNQSWFVESFLITGKEFVHSWNSRKGCVLVTDTRDIKRPPLPTKEGFTDADLRNLLKAHDKGLIYVWSPYMPLSVQNLADIRQAAKDTKTHLTVLLDGSASFSEAKKWIGKGPVTQGDMVKVASSELYARDVGIHYPATFAYSHKFLSNRNFIGNKRREIFTKWIDREIASIDSLQSKTR